MSHLILNYITNLLRLLFGRRFLHPLVTVYHVTSFCNLNCRYCEDYGTGRNAMIGTESLPLPRAKRLLDIIRQGTDRIIFSGGEPLLYPHINALLDHARNVVGFRGITLLTNGLLLSEHEAALPYLDRLLISMDSADPEVWDATLRVGTGTAARIIETVRRIAARQHELDLQVVINCVISPETLDQVDGVVAFCQRHQLALSVSPCAQNNWPRYELLVSEAYQSVMERLKSLKDEGFPLLVSQAALQVMTRFEPFRCYPTLFPQILPDGGLVYPCRPIQKSGMPHGGIGADLLAAGSWRQATRAAQASFQEPPLMCTSCFQQCYIEPSLMQTRPLALLWELARYPVARRSGLLTYTPG